MFFKLIRKGLAILTAVMVVVSGAQPIPDQKQTCVGNATSGYMRCVNDTPAVVVASATKPKPKPTPTSVFSPYVESWGSMDIGRYPGRSVTLAFLLAGAGGTLAWDGTMPLDHWLTRAKSSKKQIVLSFGGAAGTELADTDLPPAKLAAEYIRAANMYSASRLDFDIEGSGLWDTDTIHKRNVAITIVQKRLSVKIQYTLPVMPFGLDAACLALLRDAKAVGVRLDGVNVMAMNYGDSFREDMGTYAIQAAKATRAQLRDLGFKNPLVGITPMILQNDVAVERFSIQDAREVADFAAKNAWVTFVGFWSAGRDQNQKFARLFASRLS